MVTINRRKFLGFSAGTLLLSVSKISSAANNKTAEFVAVRLWPASAYTRVTLEATLPLKYQYFHLKNPERLVLDIKDAQLNDVLKIIPSKVLQRDPYVSQARVGQYTPDTVRVVFDLKTPVNPQVFTLDPVADFKNRLVVDLYPVVTGAENDPLMLLLQDYSKGKVSSDGSTVSAGQKERDLLGDKINDILAGQITGGVPEGPTRPVIPPDTTRPSTINRKLKIMLDPGHGGEDPGAVSKNGLREKDVVLNVAREAKKILESMGYQVYMTRNEDVFIPLRVRVAKARKLKTDIFISIHADAFTNPSARGTGVYALSTKGATSEAARYLAKTQNLSDAIGGVKTVGDPLIDKTLFDLAQTHTIKDSLKLGKFILNELGKINKLHKGYVDQAAFAVLKAPDIPSVLVETAFVSNPEEAILLASSAFRKKLANSISQGVRNYFRNNTALRNE